MGSFTEQLSIFFMLTTRDLVMLHAYVYNIHFYGTENNVDNSSNRII